MGMWTVWGKEQLSCSVLFTGLVCVSGVTDMLVRVIVQLQSHICLCKQIRLVNFATVTILTYYLVSH